jgi:hypothetical protein
MKTGLKNPFTILEFAIALSKIVIFHPLKH